VKSLARIYRVGIYLRLSRDDGREESQSIQTQREMLTDYALRHGWHVVDEYVDDGYSGTDFNRPGFERLISDVELGRLDIVLTKDLSRLGRSYVQMGEYIENYFPEHNVRYIAVNDGYDSDKLDGADMVAIKNVLNEMYARDTSRKIRSVLNMKARNGEPRNTVFPIFGFNYTVSYERVPDAETGPIVQMIYRKFVELGSGGKVARYLTENKIKTPRYYNAVKFNYNKAKVLSMPEEKHYTWSAGMVRDIIIREEYLGVYKTAQTSSINFKKKKRYKNKDCYVFENRYPALIDRETWDLAQKILKSSRGSSIDLSENAFKGVICCADCGRTMRIEKRNNHKKGIFDYRYYCNKTDCEHSNSISKRMLETIVVKELMALKEIILKNEEKFLEFASQFDSKGRVLVTDVEKELDRLKARCEEIDVFIEKLFEQKVLGSLPLSTFNTMMSKYKREKEALENEIGVLTRKDNEEKGKPANQLKAIELVKLFKEYDETNIIQPYIIQKLIRKIILRTSYINDSMKNREIDIKIQYYSCDEIIKGFMTYEED